MERILPLSQLCSSFGLRYDPVELWVVDGILGRSHYQVEGYAELPVALSRFVMKLTPSLRMMQKHASPTVDALIKEVICSSQIPAAIR